ncbi:MAG: sulfotransferase [Chloroflexi bacterium]|nr:sulfotransferase [Chloroflexota bacterium]
MGSRKKPILVTGSHRSGTTWVGKMIAAAPSVGYIPEPFGLYRRPGLCGAPFEYWFTYICKENEADFYPAIQQTLTFHFNSRRQWHTVRSARAVAGTSKVFLDFLRYRLAGARPLLKDPIAIFSTPWLADRFDMNVVVLIRHPAAFASSLKLLNWQIPFKHLLAQPALMRDALYPFESEITKFARSEQDLIDQAALFWKLVYRTVLQYREQHPDWIFVRHEDLSRNPLVGFRALLERLELNWTPDIEATISKYSLSRDTRDRSRDSPFVLQRNSRANLAHWKTRLTEREIARVKALVQDVSSHFYTEEEWEPESLDAIVPTNGTRKSPSAHLAELHS